MTNRELAASLSENALDLIKVEFRILLDLLQRRLGDFAQTAHGFAGQNLDLQHNFKLALLRPDAAHLGKRIPIDHNLSPFSGLNLG